MGTHFYLETDHQPLQYLQQTKYKNSRIMIWSLNCITTISFYIACNWRKWKCWCWFLE